MRELAVWLGGGRVGTLVEEGGEMRFAYAPEWLAIPASPPLSLALPPRSEPYGHDSCRAFFGGLLPEGTVRDHLARRLGVSPDNDFSLLERVGGDCAGAVSLLAPDAVPPLSPAPRYRWLDEQELAELVADLPRRPLGIDAEGEVRLSLAGAQDKLPVYCAPDGRIGLPEGGSPSSHIVKAPLRERDSVANEALCLALATELGLEAVQAAPRRVAGQELLMVRRYDRRVVGERLERLHQEDVAQALGRSSAQKYESEGGRGIAECVSLLRERSRQPARDVLALLDAVVLNVLVGNADAHAKNFSLLLDERGPRLAPLYDLLCTGCYTGLTRRMAMRIGGRADAAYLEPRHWDMLAQEAGLGIAALRRRRRALAARAPGGVALAADALARAGWEAPIAERVRAEVERRARQLAGS